MTRARGLLLDVVDVQQHRGVAVRGGAGGARAARQRRRAAHAVAQQLDFMYQEQEAYRRDAPLRRKRALARKGPSDFGLEVPELRRGP